MNIWIIIFIAFVVLTVAFGNNPWQEAREKRAQYGGDALVQSIEERNKKNQGVGGFSRGLPPPVTPQQGATTTTTTPYPSYMMPKDAAPVINQNAPVSTDENYYPPIAPPIDRDQRSEFRIKPLEREKLAYEGQKVFTFDKDGNKVPVPDGTYTLDEGHIQLNVRDGKKITF